MIPCSSKNKILSLLLMFEQMFQTNQKLAQAATKQKIITDDDQNQLINTQINTSGSGTNNQNTN